MMIEKNIKNFDTLKFAKLIGWTPEMVRERFKEIVEGEGMYFNRHTGKKQSNYQKIRPYPFLKELTLEEVANIAPHLENFPGFYEEVTSMRRYPYANGANILGYLSEVNREEVDKDAFYSPGNNIGRAGIERFYEEQLRGQKGIKYIVTSALNNAIESYGDGKYDTLAVQGPALKLGVDIILQAYGEKLLQNKRGCIVAIEPSSGEILALVSAPTYDPNLLIGKRNISENYPALVKDPSKPLYPRPLAAEYPPGSTFKLLNSLIGLQEGVISPEFGATYSVRVFLDTPGRTTSNTTGTELFATATNEEWFFDYQSGVLNFSGANLPSGISTKSVYISGARYTGEIGIANTVNTAAAAFAHANAAFAAANAAGSSTFVLWAANNSNSAFERKPLQSIIKDHFDVYINSYVVNKTEYLETNIMICSLVAL
jgi:cell division protein FtsI/penicillin-binding protein 2